MLRILRAFARLRWRSFVNTLEHSGSGNVLGRLAAASDSLVRVAVVLTMLPSLAAVAGFAGYVGWTLAQESGRIGLFQAMRFLAAAGSILVVLSPILFPSRERPNAVRLLLLPIRRRVLYTAYALAVFGHPLLLIGGAIAAGLPIGLALGGRSWAAAIVTAAGGLFLLLLNGMLVATTSAAQLVVRDRRRGEWIALALFLLLPALGLLPSLSTRHREPTGTAQPPPQRTITVDHRLMRLLPSELYLAVGRAAVHGSSIAVPMLSLGLAAGLAHVAGLALFSRVLVQGSTAGRAAVSGRGTRWRVPVVSAVVSAVAVNHMRLVLRTPRGRFSLLSPLVLLLLVLVIAPAGQDARIGSIPLASSLHVAALLAVTALLGAVPLATNQFAIEGAGLTLMLLAPLETRALLAGKALGIAVAAALPTIVGAAVALVAFPLGNPHLWLCLPLAFMSVILLSAPVAALLSAVLPRKVDLRSISRGSNAHGLAGLIGTFTILAAAALTALPAIVATHAFRSPALAPFLLLLWSTGCAVLSTALLAPLQRVFDRRRESLAILR